jgi:hypothetical protein
MADKRGNFKLMPTSYLNKAAILQYGGLAHYLNLT